MLRTPEPELMDSGAQTQAYADADFSDSNTLFVESFKDSFPGLATSGNLIDLGCGPGDICIRLSKTLPGWRITGLDAGENMLRQAKLAVDKAGAKDSVSLRLSYLPDEALETCAYDAIVSNSLMHHLPEPMSLWGTILQVGRPGAAIKVMDLCRPESEKHAAALIDTYAKDEPDVLREDFYNSLLAAYTQEEIQGQLQSTGLQYLKLSLPSDRHWIVSGTLEL